MRNQRTVTEIRVSTMGGGPVAVKKELINFCHRNFKLDVKKVHLVQMFIHFK